MSMVEKPNLKKPPAGFKKAEDILKVDHVDVYNDRVVIVRFADGTFTKSVCGEGDVFSLDTGITICLMKKLLGKDGNREYNKLIKAVHKVMAEEEAAKEKEAAEKERIRVKREKHRRKREAKRKAEYEAALRDIAETIADGIDLSHTVRREDDLK